ncbi:MAG TPA: 4Fe-4S dicluster domain-containing protein [Thermoanaerobaculia bacterium]|nr:4Fe-4S dicluster domain-containing protein [Thermoanaerobaculia bacterium]
MTQIGWILDLTKCVGCHACTVACKSENNTAPQISPLVMRNGRAITVDWRRVTEIERGTYPKVAREFVSMACNHCLEPACMKSCPVGAITKRDKDGIVLIDQEKCNGCRYCVWACPWGAPRFSEITHKVEKCTFCVQRIDAGLQPACVTTCVGRALTFGYDVGPTREVPEGFADPQLTGAQIRFVR